MKNNFSKQKEYYKNIKEIYSPYLDSKVIFNSKGWGHIIRKSGSMRPSKDINRRLSQLENAVRILLIATTVQEKEIIIQEEYSLVFLGFIAILNENKLKIILRKDNDGDYYFYSVMTGYITSVKRD